MCVCRCRLSTTGGTPSALLQPVQLEVGWNVSDIDDACRAQLLERGVVQFR